jgi:hypothetical protein
MFSLRVDEKTLTSGQVIGKTFVVPSPSFLEMYV